MPSLKDLKNRITSVKSTRKITSAMKMVAASKLRRAQDQAEAARPYVTRMARMLSTLASDIEVTDETSRLIVGTGKSESVLLLVVTSDRGLCGAFNSSVVREARREIKTLEAEGKKVKLICIGRKGRDLLRREHGDKIVHTILDLSRRKIDFPVAKELATRILTMFDADEFDTARMIYNQFKSAIAQEVTMRQIVPVPLAEKSAEPVVAGKQAQTAEPLLELFEPQKEVILADLLPRNLMVQLFSALLESMAGEQGARMTAMDNATRNAGDMIDRLSLNYNRSRQAFITKELIEIISGAEAAV